jgi:hypothetical protein
MKTSQKLSVAVLCCAAFALVTLCSNQARADLPQKTFRLHLESGLFHFYDGEIDPDGPGEYDIDGIAGGIGIPKANVGLGYVIWQGLVIGGRIQTAFYDDDYEGWGGDVFRLSILPYGEYAFLTGLFRPFVTIFLGMEGQVWDRDGGNNDYSLWGFTTGAGGGCHFFLLDRFSLDLTLLFGFAVGGGEDERPGDDVDLDYHRIDLDVMVGLSGWI